jgi:NAD(P)H-dependent FMN reductase
MISVVAVCGSLQSKSANLSLLEEAVRLGPTADCAVAIFDGLRRLPLFNPDLEGDEPEAVLAWRRAVSGHQAVLIASPEYGYSLTGSLKNGIDWLIGSGELDQKPVAITCAVPSASRGLGGLRALRDTLTAVNAVILGGEPTVKGPEQAAAISTLLRALVEAVGR